MFTSILEEDKYGISQKKFFLTQGDSCGIVSTPTNEDGEIVDASLIKKAVFKLMDNSYNISFEKELDFYKDGKYILHLTSEDTSKFSVGDHRYEIEYQLIDGGVNTTNSWKFTIVAQGTINK